MGFETESKTAGAHESRRFSCICIDDQVTWTLIVTKRLRAALFARSSASMRSPSETNSDPDSVKTVPVNPCVTESGAPIADGWDAEAPTAVHSRRPLFAGPPRLPTT